MNITDLLGKSINITIGLDDLRIVCEELSLKAVPEKAEKYLSSKQVCERYDIDNSTLWRWGQKGYLSPCKLGGKNRYRVSDLEKLLSRESP